MLIYYLLDTQAIIV